jgi:hypothetical protein
LQHSPHTHTHTHTHTHFLVKDAPEEVKARLLEHFAEKLEPRSATDEPLYDARVHRQPRLVAHAPLVLSPGTR